MLFFCFPFALLAGIDGKTLKQMVVPISIDPPPYPSDREWRRKGSEILKRSEAWGLALTVTLLGSLTFYFRGQCFNPVEIKFFASQVLDATHNYGYFRSLCSFSTAISTDFMPWVLVLYGETSQWRRWAVARKKKKKTANRKRLQTLIFLHRWLKDMSGSMYLGPRPA